MANERMYFYCQQHQEAFYFCKAMGADYYDFHFDDLPKFINQHRFCMNIEGAFSRGLELVYDDDKRINGLVAIECTDFKDKLLARE